MSLRLVTLQPQPERKVSKTEADIRKRIEMKNRRDNAYCALEILIECLRMVQQHRGSVMGFLGDHCSFAENIQKTQHSVDTCLNILADFHSVIDKKSIVRINEEWRTAAYIDQQDTALQQFEIHSHLAKHLIDFIWHVMNQHDYLMKNQQLNEILLKDFLMLIEKTGQCRALATWITSCQKQDVSLASLEKKLAFVIRDLTDSLDRIYMAFSHLETSVSDRIFTLLSQYHCRHKMAKLNEVVHQSILNSKKPQRISAESAFYLFTMAMDELYDVFHKILLISQQQPCPVIAQHY